MDERETGNKYLIALKGDDLIFINPPMRGQVISKQDALLLAAWLVAMAEGEEGEFQRVLEAVQNT